MKSSRRGFLKLSSLAVVALPLAPYLRFAPNRYVLYGDGETDDTKALQAWIDGKEVEWEDGQLISDVIPRGTFKMRGTLKIRNSQPRSIYSSEIIGSGQSVMVDVTYRNAAPFRMEHCFLNNADVAVLHRPLKMKNHKEGQ